MKSSLGLKVCLVCCFFGSEAAEVNLSPQMTNASHPTIPTRMLANPEQSATVVASRAPLILHVDGVCDDTKVVYAIVIVPPIDVVDHGEPPVASHVEPRYLVLSMGAAVNFDRAVAITGIVASTVPGFDAHARTDSPCEVAGGWLIEQQLARTLRGKIFYSHEAVLSLIGQRPAGVGSTVSVSLFSEMSEQRSMRGDLDGGRIDH